MVEKGRHQNIDRQLRYCPSCLCNLDFYIEDEFHMLLVCTLYDEHRTQCFLQTWHHCLLLQITFTELLTVAIHLLKMLRTFPGRVIALLPTFNL